MKMLYSVHAFVFFILCNIMWILYKYQTYPLIPFALSVLGNSMVNGVSDLIQTSKVCQDTNLVFILPISLGLSLLVS